MNSDTILSLISDLYAQATQLQAENQQLREALAEATNEPRAATE